MVEIEFSVLSRQCLNRRIPDIDTMKQEVAAWTKQRNEQQATVDCGATPLRFPQLGNAHQERRFTSSDARVKLKRLYPQFTCQN